MPNLTQTTAPTPDDLQKQLQRERAINRLATQTRSSLSLQTILDTAVEQIYQIIGCDRVNIWKFEPDFSWLVVAESTQLSQSLMGERFLDNCFQSRFAKVYREEYIQIIPDINTVEMIGNYRELLIRLNIRAEVLMPIFLRGQLWGLFNISESQRVRDWQMEEIDVLCKVTTQLEIAIQQSSNLEQLHSELKERQRAEAILQVKNDLLARVAAQENLTDTLNHICITLEGLLEGALCSILLLDSHNQMHEAAAPSLPDAYRRQVDGVTMGEGVGSCGTAVYRREKVIVSDIANDPLWVDFKDLAIESGLRACWSTPIVANDQSILGTFGIYYHEIHSPLKNEMALVDDLVPIIMLAIQRHQNETALKQTSQRLQEAQRIAHLGSWELDLQHNTLHWSDEIFHILEIDPQQFEPSYDAFLDLVHFEDRATVSETYAKHLQDRQPYSLVHRLQMPDGRIKYLQKQCETTQNSDGTLLFSRGTLQDITEQKKAEIQCNRVEASLRQVIEGTAPLTGEDFFPSLVRHISEALGVRYASLDQAMSDGFHVIAYFADGEFCVPSFLPYDTVPCCFQSLQNGSFCLPTNVRSLYPDNALFKELGVDSYLGIRLQNAAGDPIGNLCILHDAPLVDPEWAETLLRIFAARAGAELERYLTAQALESLNAELEDRVALRTAELAEREAKYRGLMDGAADAILLADFKGNVRDANPSAVEMLGYSLAKLTSMHFSQLHPEEEHNKLKLHFADLHQNHHAQIMGVKCIRSDGSIFFVDIRASAINVGGEILAQGIFRDISDRLQIENALRESQQFLQTILDTVPLAVFWKDHNSNYLGANRHFLRDAGLNSLSELVGKNDFDLPWDEIEAEAYRADDRSVIESDKAKLNIIETQHQKDGTKIWLETNKLPLRNLAGEVLGVLGTYQDITEQKQAEMALQESETRFRRVFDSNVVGMMFSDFSGQVSDANDCYLDLIGYSRADLEANRINWAKITPPEYIESDYRAIDQLLCYGEITPWEKQYIRPDGSRVSVLLGVALLSRDEGRCVAVVLDISDRKAAESLIRQQANRETVIREITQRIRQSLDLQTIFDTACQEIRHELEADRVGIFKFYPDSNWNDGEFVAESVVEGFSSAMAIRIYDNCFGARISNLYLKGHYSAIEDISQLTNQCYIDLLTQFQVRANLVVPLIVGDNLWGLVCIHQCSRTRQWQGLEIVLIQHLSTQLAIAIQQANLYDQAQARLIEQQKAEAKIALQLQREQALATINQLILQRSLDLDHILLTVVGQVKEALNGDRVIILQLCPDGTRSIVEEAVSNGLPRLREQHWDDEVWDQEILEYYWQGQPRIVPDVMIDHWTDCLGEYSIEGQIQSKIVAPILLDSNFNENHRWVSSHSSKKLWGVVVIHACLEKRVWSETEAQLLQQIANQVAIAIQQATLFEQLQKELSERQQAQTQLTEINQQLELSNIQLERATRLKDEFLANMSHELRTPLNAILGMTEGMQEEVFGIVNEKQLKALHTVKKSALHLLALINDILDVAKIESGKIKLDPSLVSIEQLCSSSLTFVKQQAQGKRIQLKTIIPPHLPDLFVDETRMRQVLLNLLTNAVKFTPEGGQITLTVNSKCFDTIESPPLQGITRIRTHRTPWERNLGIKNDGECQPANHYIQFAISDTGIGIAPENINKLFKPFIQIDSALNRQYAGTGLGLALVKSIVELHGGNVSLTSELGKGSCFTINIPYHSQFPLDIYPKGLAIAPEFDHSQTNASDPTSIPTNEPITAPSPLVLLAEDNLANVATITSYLEAKGYRLLFAHDGHEAVDLALSQHPDVILMDVQMPNVDGLEAMRQIRQQESLRNIPIIAVTALAMKGDKEKCLAAGADLYLSKPVKLRQLDLSIKELLQR